MKRVSIAEAQSQILALVEGILQQNSIRADVTPQAHLADIGLTSMDLVGLMLGVEAEFDFTISQTDLTPENFKSVDAIVRMVSSYIQQSKAA